MEDAKIWSGRRILHGGEAIKDLRWGAIDRQKALAYALALSSICAKSESLNY